MAKKIVIDIDILESILRNIAYTTDYYYPSNFHACIPELNDENKKIYHSLISSSVDNALRSALGSIDQKITQSRTKLIVDFIEAIKSSSADYHGCQLCVPFNTSQS